MEPSQENPYLKPIAVLNMHVTLASHQLCLQEKWLIMGPFKGFPVCSPKVCFFFVCLLVSVQFVQMMHVTVGYSRARKQLPTPGKGEGRLRSTFGGSKDAQVELAPLFTDIAAASWFAIVSVWPSQKQVTIKLLENRG